MVKVAFLLWVYNADHGPSSDPQVASRRKRTSSKKQGPCLAGGHPEAIYGDTGGTISEYLVSIRNESSPGPCQ